MHAENEIWTGIGVLTFVGLPSGRRLGSCSSGSDLKPIGNTIRVVETNRRRNITTRRADSAVGLPTGAQVFGSSRCQVRPAETLILIGVHTSQLPDEVDAAVPDQTVSCTFPHSLKGRLGSDRHESGQGEVEVY